MSSLQKKIWLFVNSGVKHHEKGCWFHGILVKIVACGEFCCVFRGLSLQLFVFLPAEGFYCQRCPCTMCLCAIFILLDCSELVKMLCIYFSLLSRAEKNIQILSLFSKP